MPNSTRNCLGDIALRWMVRQVVQAQCGITFDNDALKRANIPDSVFVGEGFPVSPPATARRPPSRHSPHLTVRDPDQKRQRSSIEKDAAGQKRLEAFGYGRHSAESDASRASEDSTASAASAIDAVQPIHDELVLDKWWWLLEIIPTNYAWQDGKGKWHSKWGSVLFLSLSPCARGG